MSPASSPPPRPGSGDGLVNATACATLLALGGLSWLAVLAVGYVLWQAVEAIA